MIDYTVFCSKTKMYAVDYSPQAKLPSVILLYHCLSVSINCLTIILIMIIIIIVIIIIIIILIDQTIY